MTKRRRSISLRALALTLFVVGGVYVAAFAISVGRLVGPAATTMRTDTELIRNELNALVASGLALRNLVDQARSASDSASIEPVLIQLSEQQPGVPVVTSQRLGKIPDDLRLTLEALAGIEGRLIATIRKVTDNLELGRPAAAELTLARTKS